MFVSGLGRSTGHYRLSKNESTKQGNGRFLTADRFEILHGLMEQEGAATVS